MRFPDAFRVTSGGLRSKPGEPAGLFILPAVVPGRALHCIATDGRGKFGLGWEHVSVSIKGRPDRLPTWPEMDAVRHVFWTPDVWVMQFHPPTSEHRSIAEVLHLFRPVAGEFPTPPGQTVAPKDPGRVAKMIEVMSREGLSDEEVYAALMTEVNEPPPGAS